MVIKQVSIRLLRQVLGVSAEELSSWEGEKKTTTPGSNICLSGQDQEIMLAEGGIVGRKVLQEDKNNVCYTYENISQGPRSMEKVSEGLSQLLNDYYFS